MKGKIAVGSLICLLVLSGTHLFRTNARPAPTGFLWESGAFGVMNSEFPAVKIINVDTVPHNYRVVIYRASGASLPVVLDTGVLSVPSGNLVYAIGPVETLGAQDDYSAEITSDSDHIIPVVLAQIPGCDPNCHLPRVELHGSELTQFKQAF